MYRASGKPSGSLAKPAEESAAAEHEKVARLDSSESQQTVVDTPKQSKTAAAWEEQCWGRQPAGSDRSQSGRSQEGHQEVLRHTRSFWIDVSPQNPGQRLGNQARAGRPKSRRDSPPPAHMTGVVKEDVLRHQTQEPS